VLQDVDEKTGERRVALAERAKALAIVLREEFGISFTFHDAADGSLLPDSDPHTHDPLSSPLDAATVREMAEDGRAHVSRLADGRYRLGLLLYDAQKPILVAVGETAPETEPRPAGSREETMLRGWLQAVSDRLRLAEQLASRRRLEEAQNTQSTSPWEALLALDQVARRLRVHKEPARNHQRILEAAFGQLKVQSLVWIPNQREQAELFVGESCLAPEECRQLAGFLAQSPEFRAPAPLLCNETASTLWGSRYPNIHNLLGFLVADQEPLGWLVALNKKGPSAFRRSDAALLLPFVALLELHLRWSHRYQDLKELLAGLTRSLTTALDAKDTYTYGHSERVARIAVELGRELGLEGDELGDIYLAGLLHDVGKIGIKDTVLHKHDTLTPEEQEHIQQHVTIGYWILAELRPIRNLLPGVLYHHERYDGTGYPDGLAGENIPLLARILAVADAYDAMSHQRPYRDSIPYRRVEEILVEGAGTQWDKQVVDAFLRCRQRVHAIRQRGVGDSLRQAIDGALRSGVESLRPTPSLLRKPKDEG
jgi:HD-GYP domain-containing protein (c-di-GMP phosphodiesterase class II)